jgi:hypothetical protein
MCLGIWRLRAVVAGCQLSVKAKPRLGIQGE